MMTADVYVRHYVAVAEESPVPVLLYNVTMFTGVTLPPDAVGLLAQHPNIVGIKESGSDASLLADYIARSGPEFFVLAGSGVTYFSGLVAGADGAILALGERRARSAAPTSSTTCGPAASPRPAPSSAASRPWPARSAACTACRRSRPRST